MTDLRDIIENDHSLVLFFLLRLFLPALEIIGQGEFGAVTAVPIVEPGFGIGFAPGLRPRYRVY